MNTVETVTNESGDWVVLIVDGEVYYEGHSIPTDEWLMLLKKFGLETIEKEISDEEMEGRAF